MSLHNFQGAHERQPSRIVIEDCVYMEFLEIPIFFTHIESEYFDFQIFFFSICWWFESFRSLIATATEKQENEMTVELTPMKIRAQIKKNCRWVAERRKLFSVRKWAKQRNAFSVRLNFLVFRIKELFLSFLFLFDVVARRTDGLVCAKREDLARCYIINTIYFFTSFQSRLWI